MRLVLAARGRSAQPAGIRLGIAAASITILFLQLRTFNGLSAGTALLASGRGLEVSRDCKRGAIFHLVVLIIYFLCLPALLRSESFWLLVYLIGVSWLTGATLAAPHARRRPARMAADLRYAGRISAQALPVAVVLWLFFPRFDAPLWQLPAEARQRAVRAQRQHEPRRHRRISHSRMRSPFACASTAMRRRRRAERYWRGPVLHETDGHTWRRTLGPTAEAPLMPSRNAAYRYTLSLEPHPHNWLFALDWPDRWNAPGAASTPTIPWCRARRCRGPIDFTARLAHPIVHDGGAESRRAPPRHALAAGPQSSDHRLLAELRRSHPGRLGLCAGGARSVPRGAVLLHALTAAAWRGLGR